MTIMWANPLNRWHDESSVSHALHPDTSKAVCGVVAYAYGQVTPEPRGNPCARCAAHIRAREQGFGDKAEWIRTVERVVACWGPGWTLAPVEGRDCTYIAAFEGSPRLTLQPPGVGFARIFFCPADPADTRLSLGQGAHRPVQSIARDIRRRAAAEFGLTIEGP